MKKHFLINFLLTSGGFGQKNTRMPSIIALSRTTVKERKKHKKSKNDKEDLLFFHKVVRFRY